MESKHFQGVRIFRPKKLLEPSWVPLGILLEASCELLDASWGLFEAPWAVLEVSQRLLKASWGPRRSLFRSSWNFKTPQDAPRHLQKGPKTVQQTPKMNPSPTRRFQRHPQDTPRPFWDLRELPSEVGAVSAVGAVVVSVSSVPVKRPDGQFACTLK